MFTGYFTAQFDYTRIRCVQVMALTALFFSFCHAEEKSKDEFRNYADAIERVRFFYEQNHAHQTLTFVLDKEKEYLSLSKRKMSIWDAMNMLDTLVDESDPDLDLPQSYHLFQTAEALRKDGQPRWLILTGFIHDLGKILALNGEPQWAVVGDTFPVGCQYSDKIVFKEYLALNPDCQNSLLQSKYGIYAPQCGLENVHMSWGHDEYLYHVVKNYLPKEGAFIIRYHSFYPLHKENEYQYLLSDQDKSLVPWLKLFCQYDLYSKSEERLDIQALKPYYEDLVAEFFPSQLDW